MLDVSVRTIDRYISRRFIRPSVLRSGSVRIPISEIEKCFKPSINDFLKGGNDNGLP